MRTSGFDLLRCHLITGARRACLWLIVLWWWLAPWALAHAAPITKQTTTPLLSYSLLAEQPREARHFTQGLVYDRDFLYESTGKYGQSALHVYHKKDLSLATSRTLNNDQFAEGITVLNEKLYQLEWRAGLMHVYTLALEPLQTLPIASEGWGLTTDGMQLLLSDGTGTISFLDPDTAKVKKTIHVTDRQGKSWQNLNELEWVNGVLLANVWHQDVVLAIDPANGSVIGQYDFSALAQRAGKAMSFRDGEQVTNGLAWDASTQTLLITGKDWPRWFTVKLSPVPSLPPPIHQGRP